MKYNCKCEIFDVISKAKANSDYLKSRAAAGIVSPAISENRALVIANFFKSGCKISIK